MCDGPAECLHAYVADGWTVPERLTSVSRLLGAGEKVLQRLVAICSRTSACASARMDATTSMI
eukprot:360335-Chlamydomonas_euryale.AAC.5